MHVQRSCSTINTSHITSSRTFHHTRWCTKADAIQRANISSRHSRCVLALFVCGPTCADATVGFGQFLDGHPQIAERIRTCGPKPISAFDEAHRHKTAVRSDWSQVHVSKVCPLLGLTFQCMYLTHPFRFFGMTHFQMETVLKLKFTQHRHLKQMLLDTGDAELLEVRPCCRHPLQCQGTLILPFWCIKKDSPRDWFWGIGADGTGNNELGKALMRLREELSAFRFS